MSKVTSIVYDSLMKEEEVIENTRMFEEEDKLKPGVGIHNRGEVLDLIRLSQYVKEYQIASYRNKWYEKKVQGIVGRSSGKRIEHTTYFINSNTLTPDAKLTFIKMSLGLCVTKADKKKWGLIKDVTCLLCGCAEETIHHLLTSCTALKHLHITRHNVIMRLIMKHLISIENLTMAYCDAEWDTIEKRKNNRPDIVIVAPSDTRILPSPFKKKLKKDCITILDVAVCWNTSIEEKRKEKINKYLPLLETLKKEMNREEEVCDAICIGTLGSISEETYQTMVSCLGIEPKEVEKLLKEINIELVKETCKIWKHASILNSYN